ncbi:MAG: 4-(cytidine 5'-diphospho)-2-C-methyl-D-erythritol kinase [Rhodocyclaceae bacterium]
MSDWERDFPAPAKLNLFLHVVGRRADGYHLLQTAFRLIDRGDTLRFAPAPGGEVRLRDPLPGVPVEEDLAVRAAVLLLREADAHGRGVEIRRIKRLPVGGGLGGGSSNAATVLMALNRLWGIGWPRERLQALGLSLGADVPFFVFGESAAAEGVGELLSPLALDPAWYAVIEPGVAVSTARVFADPGLTRNANPIKMAPFSAGWGRNDLQSVVCARYPEVRLALDWLARHGQARMSGSGSCVFAAFPDEAMARSALAGLPGRWRGWVARGLDRHPLHDWAF